jgi:hypothetical protein
VDAGTVVFSKNDHSDTFWSVVFGSVAIQAGDESDSVYSLGQGDCFGEMGLISGRPGRNRSCVGESALLEQAQSDPADGYGAVDQGGCRAPVRPASAPHLIFPRADPASGSSSRTAARVTLERPRPRRRRPRTRSMRSSRSVKISRKNENGIDVARRTCPLATTWARWRWSAMRHGARP